MAQKDYYAILGRQPNFKHAVGISMAVQSVHNFTPTPNYTPAEIAYFKGVDARRRGRPETDNDYPDEQKNLSAEWMRGYGKTNDSAA
jgi:hypothetical protein